MAHKLGKQRDNLQDTLAHITEVLQRYELVDKMVHQQHQPRQKLVESLVARQGLNQIKRQLDKLHPADIAYVLEALPLSRRLLVWDQVDEQQHGAVLLEAADAVRETLIADMESSELVDAAGHLDSDEIADLVPDLPKEVVPDLMMALPQDERQRVQSALNFPEDSVGALMEFDVPAVRDDVTLDVVLRFLRLRGKLPDNSGRIMVVDRKGDLKGALSLEDLLTCDGETRVQEVMDTEPVVFHSNEPAIEAAQAFERYGLIVAPVINVHNRLVGVVKVDMLMDLLEEHRQKHLLAQAGLTEEEDLFAPFWESGRNRWPWLALNLLIAFIASRVIGQFEETIAQVVALAALLPITANVGGNAGNQVVALVIRGLALKQLDPSNLKHLMTKELAIGLMNGAIWGIAMGLVTLMLYGNPNLALVMFLAMIITLVVAAVIGVVVPLGLQKAGHDPVLGSSVIITGSTDTLGFLIFLGLAATLL